MALAIRKRGKIYHARGSVPSRQASGEIVRVRIEQSLRTERLPEARKRAADLERYYYDLAHGKIEKRGPTFAEAALTYLQTRGKDDRFLPRLLAELGDTPISEIDQSRLADCCHRLYPGRSASTHNRAVFAPAITIMRLSGVTGSFRRPTVGRKQVSCPPDDWFDRVLPHCPPRLAALLVFITLTGRRITEALEAEMNEDGKSVTIGRTKTGNAVVVPLPSLVLDVLSGGNGDRGNPSRRLFGYSDRHNVYRALRQACKRAGVPYYGTHAIGRHAFATRLLREGKSLKFVADAGGWASIKMPAQHYAHLEKSEVQEEVARIGQEWGKRLKKMEKPNENK